MKAKDTKLKSLFKKFGIFIENLLFPDDIKCIFCGTDVPDFADKPFCEECEKLVEFNNGNCCIICDEPIENEAIVCDNCQKHKRFFKKAFCPFVYSGLVRKAILDYKISNQRYKAKTFAKYIASRIVDSKIKIDCITYVPMTKKKERERGFNQAKLLAEEIGKILKIDVVSCFEKLKDNAGQKYSNYQERQENMLGMYALLPVRLDKDANCLIVDDIITTGATVNYCAGLIAKRVKNVYVCAVARNKKKFQKNK